MKFTNFNEKVLFQLLMVDTPKGLECHVEQADQDMSETPLLTYAIRMLITLCGREAFDYALSRINEAKIEEVKEEDRMLS